MPRPKAYDKAVVTQKAMNLFWKHGFHSTSMQMLEKEMGINKFSIYEAFGSKEGLMEACIEHYAAQLNELVETMRRSQEGVEAIRQYFHDFTKFSAEQSMQKGCLVTNTTDEVLHTCHPRLRALLLDASEGVKSAFEEKLKETGKYSDAESRQKADFLFVSMFGFSMATKVYSPTQLRNYIDHIFSAL